jgi:hypothetical protein
MDQETSVKVSAGRSNIYTLHKSPLHFAIQVNMRMITSLLFTLSVSFFAELSLAAPLGDSGASLEILKRGEGLYQSFPYCSHYFNLNLV